MDLMKGQAAIFDLDGTLLDSTDVWHRIDRAFLARRGLDLPADYPRAVASMHLHEAAVYTVERFSLTDRPDDVVAEWLAMAKEAYAHQISLKPGAIAFLAQLRERGVRLAVATALARELDCSESSVKMQLMRLRRQLRDFLEKEDISL